MKQINQSTRGNAAVEMALILMPLVFILLSSGEVMRGMWAYHTLSAAIKTTARYATVHGADCAAVTSTCQTTVANIASMVSRSAVGIDPSRLQLTLTAGGNDYTCGTLTACLADGTSWPPAGGNSSGSEIKILGTYSFKSILGSFWPGQGSANLSLVAESRETIQF